MLESARELLLKRLVMLFHPSRHRWCHFHELLKPTYGAQPRAYYGVIVALVGLWLPLTGALEWLFVRVAQRRTDMKRKLKKSIQECVPRHYPRPR